MTDHLQPVDPHDPGISAIQIARRVDELVRALNYATRPGDPRLDNVPDTYSILGALREALGKLPQACTQLAVGLHDYETTGPLRAEQGWPHAGNPREAIVHAAAMLGEAADSSALAGDALGRAQTAISGVSHGVPEKTSTRRAETHRLGTPAVPTQVEGADPPGPA